MADAFVESAKDHLKKNQKVRYVALRQSKKEKKRVEASLVAVEEFEARSFINSAEIGDELEVQVDRIRKNYVQVQTIDGSIPGRVYAQELDHSVGTPGELQRSVREGERFLARVVGKVAQDGWVDDSRKRGAYLKLSRVACLPEREAETMQMRFGANPFCIETSPRLPRRFDPVARFVFEAIHEGASRDQIQAASHLPDESLRAIRELLNELDLVDLSGRVTARGKKVTARGKKMYEAMQWSDAFNQKNYEGLFATAAPLRKAFSSIKDIIETDDTPEGWPQDLMWCPQTKKELMRATDEDLSGFPFEQIFSGDAIEEVRSAVSDPHLWVYLRPAKGRPRYCPVTATITDEWLLATLWRHFDSAEVDSPFRPNQKKVPSRAKRLHLVEVKVRVSTTEANEGVSEEDQTLDSEDAESGAPQYDSFVFWWEPTSDTFWSSRRRLKHRPRALNASSCPELPDEWWKRIQDLQHSEHAPEVERMTWKSVVSYYGS